MFHEPFKLGTCVVIVCEHTLKRSADIYHGTVVRPITRRLFAYPEQQNKWAYRVFLPLLGREIDVPATWLLATGLVDDFKLPTETICQIQFDEIPQTDETEIYGAYLFQGPEWVHFHFRKRDQEFHSFQLNMSLGKSKNFVHRLVYDVGRQATLDSAFVTDAIRSIIGVPDNTIE